MEKNYMCTTKNYMCTISQYLVIRFVITHQIFHCRSISCSLIGQGKFQNQHSVFSRPTVYICVSIIMYSLRFLCISTFSGSVLQIIQLVVSVLNTRWEHQMVQCFTGGNFRYLDFSWFCVLTLLNQKVDIADEILDSRRNS